KRLTARLRAAAGAAVADGGRTVLQSARDHEMSWPVVAAAFAAHAAAVLPVQPQRRGVGHRRDPGQIIRRESAAGSIWGTMLNSASEQHGSANDN
ncbi:hypothetical protein AB0M52_16775, partial [Micromonospora sp. NPDC051296]